jgi:ribosomal protein S24E
MKKTYEVVITVNVESKHVPTLEEIGKAIATHLPTAQSTLVVEAITGKSIGVLTAKIDAPIET